MSPRAHRAASAVAAKHARLGEPHVAPLVQLADRIAADTGGPGAVPYPDPTFAGVDARALFLLETPAAKAARSTGGSGLLSLDNDDVTAETMHRAYDAAGLSRSDTLHWNAVPWIVPGTERGDLSGVHVPAALPWLAELLGMLHKIQVVVTVGGTARDAWLRCLAERPEVPLLPTLHSPHTSARGLMRPGSRERLASVLKRVAAVIARQKISREEPNEEVTFTGRRVAASRSGTGYARYEVGPGCFLTLFDDGSVRFAVKPTPGWSIKPWHNDSNAPGAHVVDVKRMN